MDTTLALYTCMGFFGGLVHSLLIARTYREFRSFKSLKLLVIGAVVGFVYYFLHSDWTYPNTVMSFVSGYAGPAFIESLIARVRAK